MVYGALIQSGPSSGFWRAAAAETGDIEDFAMTEPTVLNPDAASRLLLFVDHASSHVPEEFDALGLRQDALEEHIGWDIGAATLAHGLAKCLGVPSVLAAVSRLVVDTNRDPSD